MKALNLLLSLSVLACAIVVLIGLLFAPEPSLPPVSCLVEEEALTTESRALEICGEMLEECMIETGYELEYPPHPPQWSYDPGTIKEL